jgi:hypothetical protein
LNHGNDDVYDAAYEMDPFYIDTSVDTIQAYASKFALHSSMNEKVCMPKVKGFAIDQKTKEL